MSVGAHVSRPGRQRGPKIQIVPWAATSVAGRKYDTRMGTLRHVRPPLVVRSRSVVKAFGAPMLRVAKPTSAETNANEVMPRGTCSLRNDAPPSRLAQRR